MGGEDLGDIPACLGRRPGAGESTLNPTPTQGRSRGYVHATDVRQLNRERKAAGATQICLHGPELSRANVLGSGPAADVIAAQSLCQQVRNAHASVRRALAALRGRRRAGAGEPIRLRTRLGRAQGLLISARASRTPSPARWARRVIRGQAPGPQLIGVSGIGLSMPDPRSVVRACRI